MGAEGIGLLLSAISGGGNAALTNLQEQQKQQGAIDLEQAKSDAEIARQKAIIDYNTQAMSQQRGAKVAAINQGAQDLATQRAGLLNQPVIDQSNADVELLANTPVNDKFTQADKDAAIEAAQSYRADNTVNPAVSDADTLRASVSAGYTDPLDLVKMNREESQNQTQSRLAAAKEAMAQNFADRTVEMQQASADRLQAILSKQGENGSTTAKGDVAKLIDNQLTVQQNVVKELDQASRDPNSSDAERAAVLPQLQYERLKLAAIQVMGVSHLKTMGVDTSALENLPTAPKGGSKVDTLFPVKK